MGRKKGFRFMQSHQGELERLKAYFESRKIPARPSWMFDYSDPTKLGTVFHLPVGFTMEYGLDTSVGVVILARNDLHITVAIIETDPVPVERPLLGDRILQELTSPFSVGLGTGRSIVRWSGQVLISHRVWEQWNLDPFGRFQLDVLVEAQATSGHLLAKRLSRKKTADFKKILGTLQESPRFREVVSPD